MISAPPSGIGARTSGTSSPGIAVQASWLLLNNILTIADQLMDPKVHHLFKHSGYNEAIAKIFKTVIFSMINVNATPVELKIIVERVLRAQPIQCSSEDLSYVLVSLIKSTLKDCFITSAELVNEIEAACSWHIFMKELKELQEAYEPTLKIISEWKRPVNTKTWDDDYDFLPSKPIQQCFLNYLGHLCALRNVHITKAIHNLFYLLNKVANEKQSDMTRRELGTFIAGNVLYVLVRNQFPQDEVNKLSKKECNYFAKICEHMVRHPIFANPFRVEDYATYSQSLDAHREMRPFVVRCLFPSRVLTFGAQVKKENSIEDGLAKLSLLSKKESKLSEAQASDEITVLNPITLSPHILVRAKKVITKVPFRSGLRFDLDDKAHDKAPAALPLKPPPLALGSKTSVGVEDVIAELQSRLILNSFDASKEDGTKGPQTPRRRDTRDDLKRDDLNFKRDESKKGGPPL